MRKGTGVQAPRPASLDLMKPTPISPLHPQQEEHIDARGVVWRTLPHQPTIRVSVLGEVEVLDHRGGTMVSGAREGTWKPRAAKLKKGLLFVAAVERKANGYVHHLVAHAFFGEVAWLRRVSHVNADQTDNRVENLCVVEGLSPRTSAPFQRKPQPSRKGRPFGYKKPGKEPAPEPPPPKITDHDAQRLIDEWFAFQHENYEELGAAFGVAADAANRIVLGYRFPHLDRPEKKIRYQPRKYEVKTIMAMVKTWNDGEFATKKELGIAFGLPHSLVVNVLNGKVSRLERQSYRVGVKSWGKFRGDGVG